MSRARKPRCGAADAAWSRPIDDLAFLLPPADPTPRHAAAHATGKLDPIWMPSHLSPRPCRSFALPTLPFQFSSAICEVLAPSAPSRWALPRRIGPRLATKVSIGRYLQTHSVRVTILAADARGWVTTYSYDNVNRPTGKSYSGDGGVTPPVTYTYDSGTNGVGRMTGWSSTNGVSGGAEYDVRGRTRLGNGSRCLRTRSTRSTTTTISPARRPSSSIRTGTRSSTTTTRSVS